MRSARRGRYRQALEPSWRACPTYRMPACRRGRTRPIMRWWQSGASARRLPSRPAIMSISARRSAAWTANWRARSPARALPCSAEPLAQLHRALIQFMLDLHTHRAPAPKSTCPTSSTAIRCAAPGQLPKFAEDLFRLEGDQEYYLIPTAEVPVTNIARDRIFEAGELDERGIRFVCHSPCFAARPAATAAIPGA
jgi:seryl-tRNA synthetase